MNAPTTEFLLRVNGIQPAFGVEFGGDSPRAAEARAADPYHQANVSYSLVHSYLELGADRRRPRRGDRPTGFARGKHPQTELALGLRYGPPGRVDRPLGRHATAANGGNGRVVNRENKRLPLREEFHAQLVSSEMPRRARCQSVGRAPHELAGGAVRSGTSAPRGSDFARQGALSGPLRRIEG